jgi:hypothetical protein
VLVVADVVLVVGCFLPWVISGDSRRDSFATVRAAQRVGVVGKPFWETVLSVWYLAPLAAAVVLVGVAFDRRRLVPAVAAGLGALSLVVSGVVLVAPIDRGVGPGVVAVAGVGLVTGSVLWVRAHRRRTSPAAEPTVR